MTRLLSMSIGLVLLASLSSSLSANTLTSRSPSKNELIKRCMVKSMSARRDLHYNEAAKDCAAQVELQSSTVTPAAPAPAKS